MIRDLKIPQPKAWNHNQIWFELTGTSWEVMRKWDFVFRQIELKYFEVLMMLFYEFLKRQFLLQLENHLKHRMKSKLRFEERSITWNLSYRSLFLIPDSEGSGLWQGSLRSIVCFAFYPVCGSINGERVICGPFGEEYVNDKP